MPGIRLLACVAALLVAVSGVLGGRAAPVGAAPAAATWTAHTSGPDVRAFRCAGTWSPIQAMVSGFVIGNCRGGTAVRGIATDECAPGCIRGARSEGRGWAAVSLPDPAHFAACGWMNVTNRLDLGGAPPRSRCTQVTGPDQPLLSTYVKRFTGDAVAGARLPSSTKYAGLYVWAGHFTSGANKGHEGGGMRYRPHLRTAATRCRAYANVNPWLPWQRVRASERMWAVHDDSPHLTIRYIARFQAADEHGRMQWWVNAHSSAPADRARPWGFVAAGCLFGSAHATRPVVAVAHRQRPAPAHKCLFGPTPFHEILDRRGIGCAAAKAVLRAMRGDHRLVPIACHAPRSVRGWQLTNLLHDPSFGITRYRARHRAFSFARHQFPGQIWCPA